MRVFMLGWEFPPYISGGLGTACYGLTRGLSEVGVDVTFVLPRAVVAGEHTHVDILTPAALPQPIAPPAPNTTSGAHSAAPAPYALDAPLADAAPPPPPPAN